MLNVCKEHDVRSISPWENHTPKASYWSGRVQVLIRTPSQGDIPDVGLVTLPPPSKAGVPTAALGGISLSDTSLDHGQPLCWSKPSTSQNPPQVALFGWPALNESTICYEYKLLTEPHLKS